MARRALSGGGHWPNGSTWAWRKARERVFETKGRDCLLQLDGCTRYADTVHHTGDRNITGDDPEHLVPACNPCNVRAGNPADYADPDPLPEW